MGYNNTPKSISPGLGGWTYQGTVASGDPSPGNFRVDQTSMSSGTPTFEINVTDASGISHLDWLQDLVNTNHLILRERNRPANSLVLEISSNTPGAGFQTIVGDIRSGNGTFEVGVTYDIWEVTTSEDFITGPDPSTTNSIPTFSTTTGKVLQDNPTLLYTSGEVQLTAATAALEIQERAAAPASAADRGHVWVKDDALNVLTFTDDIGTDYPLHGPEKTVALGTWSFGSSTLGTPAAGVFDTDNATLTSITAVRFNGAPASGQAITNWSTLLPQEGILYLQDITKPGEVSVTFPYTSITFPAGASYPQFNGPSLSINGTVQGTNWSVNNYSLQLVSMSPPLEDIINGSEVDNDVIVIIGLPIVFSDNAVTLTPLTIISTNATAATPSVLVTRLFSTDIGLRVSYTNFQGLYFGTNKIEPQENSVTSGNTTYSFDPQDTTSGTYHGRDVEIVGGDHSGSQDGGDLLLDGGLSASGTDGVILIGVNGPAEEITLSTGFSIQEGVAQPSLVASDRAQFWLSNDHDETAQPGVTIQDNHVLTMTQYASAQGNDVELSWFSANYKARMGMQLAFGQLEDNGVKGGSPGKNAADTDVSYIYDHLANMWYMSFTDTSLGDAKVSSSSDGYTWANFKTIDTSIPAEALSQPCTNGTNLGIAADGLFYLSTDLTSDGLGTFTGNAVGITDTTGLVWHIGSQLWVMCGDNGATGYIYTSPAAGTTWTLRYTFPGGIFPKTMDIAHPGYGGYNGGERIAIFCGTTSTNLFWSDTGTTWAQDTGSNPTGGLMHVMWCPSIATNKTANKANNSGAWVGMDSSKNLYIARGNEAGTWDDTGTSADWLFKTDEWCGYGTATTTATNLYQIISVSDGGAATGGWIRGRHVGALWYASLPLFRSSDTGRARFTWGNGVILFDREDSELMIGRYGPIT